MEIKQSISMIRGKSDKAEAFRIGTYGEEKIKRLEPAKPLDNNIIELKTALSFRKRLVRVGTGYESTMNVRKHSVWGGQRDMIVCIAQAKITTNKQYGKQIEERIIELI